MISLVIEHRVTADMPDGQPLPPFIEDGATWHAVRRSHHKTLWRRIVLKEENALAHHSNSEERP